MAEGLADPWPWMLLAAYFGGTGLGFLSRALGRRLSRRRGSPVRPSIFGMLLVSSSLLCAAGLLVFSDRSSLFEPLFLYSGLSTFALGILSGLLPRTFGVAFLVALAAAVAYVGASLDGWLPLTKAQRIATLTPFVVSPTAFQGELAVEERDSVPIIQRLDLKEANAGLLVERLELGGPLSLFGPEHYRIAGITSSTANGSLSIAADFAPGSSPLDIVLPLDPTPTAERSLLFARRWRESTLPRALVAFDVLAFELDPRASSSSELRVVEK
ncbi:MAG TPA: hypothetical protein VMV83_12340 [Rectinemataceae bacterium]|nr:hypothetical protein [Rectinemataceae bacterium]